MLVKKASAFQEDCIRFPLQKGQGVVGRALSARASCFCNDFTMLSVTQYPLVTGACRSGLGSSFAICLQDIVTADVYVVEFVLTIQGTNRSLEQTVK